MSVPPRSIVMSMSPNIAERFVDGKGVMEMDGRDAGAGRFNALRFTCSRLIVYGVESASGRPGERTGVAISRSVSSRTSGPFVWWKEDVDIRCVGEGSGPNCSFLLVCGVTNFFCVG